MCVSKMCGWGGGFQERETHAGASKYESIFLGGRTGVRMQALGCVDLHSLKLTGSDGWCLPQNEGGTGTAMVHCPISVTGGFHAFPWHEATGGTCPDIVMGGRKEVLTTGLGKEARAGAKARRANRRRKGEGDGKGGSERRKREAEARGGSERWKREAEARGGSSGSSLILRRGPPHTATTMRHTLHNHDKHSAHTQRLPQWP